MPCSGTIRDTFLAFDFQFTLDALAALRRLQHRTLRFVTRSGCIEAYAIRLAGITAVVIIRSEL